MGAALTIAACLKWACLRPDVDALHGTVHLDPVRYGLSDADRAALEVALGLGERWGGSVVAVTAGPVAAEACLREALACGATRAVRASLPEGAPSSAVAVALARVVGRTGAGIVVCGAHSADGGSGAVPAFLAADLGAAQMLGLVGARAVDGPPGRVRGVRRLDGGRREVVEAGAPVVASVEGSVARLRRAPLPAVLACHDAAVEVVAGPALRSEDAYIVRGSRPYRPRARVLPAPPGATALERVRALTQVGVARRPPEQVTLAPGEAAERILAALAGWGEWQGPGWDADSTG